MRFSLMVQRTHYTLRPADPGEASAVAALLRTAVPESVRPLTILGQEGVARWIAQSIREAPEASAPTRCFLVVATQDSICGAAEWRRVGPTLFLNGIAVDARHQQRGLGTQILRWGLDAFDDASRLALDVFRTNIVARAWYERLGFHITGRRQWLVCPLRAGVDSWAEHSRSERSPNARLCNEADARVEHERFDFSTLHFETQPPSTSHRHEVGRLGDDYFRITDPSTLRARPVRRALLARAPSRSLFYLAPTSFSDLPKCLRGQAACRAESLRMEASMPSVENALPESCSPP